MKSMWINPSIDELDVKMTEMTLFKEGSDGALSETVQAEIGLPVGKHPKDS